MLRLYLIRHGESVANRSRVYAGTMDVPLAPEGRRQAERLGLRFQNIPLDAIVASDLQRAADTARAIAAAQRKPLRTPTEVAGDSDVVGDLEVIVDPRLREACFGRWEGRSFQDIMDEDAERFWQWWEGDGDAAPPGGESWNALCQRVWAVFDEWRSKIPEGAAAFVAHTGPIRALVSRVLHIDRRHAFRLQIDNASVSVLHVYPDDVIVGGLNDTSHLRL